MPPAIQLLTISEVCRLTRLAQSTVYLLIRERAFPRPIKLGQRSRWLEHEIYDWIARQQAEGKA